MRGTSYLAERSESADITIDLATKIWAAFVVLCRAICRSLELANQDACSPKEGLSSLDGEMVAAPG